ncbi:MAG: hypothetical protein IJ776_06195 [Paludibacteraceae bacterium]|nr:hypothetical protein [Paludibacteraceae bacterium]
MKALLTHWYIWVLTYILGIISLLAAVINDIELLLFFSLLLMFVGILMLVILLIAAIIMPKAKLIRKTETILSITAGIVFFFVAAFFAAVVIGVGQHHPPRRSEAEEPVSDTVSLQVEELHDYPELLQYPDSATTGMP